MSLEHDFWNLLFLVASPGPLKSNCTGCEWSLIADKTEISTNLVRPTLRCYGYQKSYNAQFKAIINVSIKALEIISHNYSSAGDYFFLSVCVCVCA